ncbi:hypothetical protein [Yeosuana sp.]|uniref:hypothetical protein n=1 Tax=Yeosuana sp. TaxID=2529388 RepID=UPI004055225E
MTQINSTNFYREWLKAVTDRKEEMLSVWRKNKELTFFVKGSENSIIYTISKKIGLLSYEQDYYSIDTILYKPEDLTPGIKPNTFWFRDIRVAFEHENTFKSGIYQELSHLLITNCELKVLVTYPDDTPIQELKHLHKIVKETRHSKEISDKENLLIIFGYENNFEWQGFIYKESEWKSIN